MVTISTFYDKNINYTIEEYKEMAETDISIQTNIEKRKVHI